MVKIRKMIGKDSPPSQNMTADEGIMEAKSCHGDMRSSGGANVNNRSCCEHGRRSKRVIRSTVGCQTEDPNFVTPLATTSVTSSPKKEDTSKKSEGTLRLMIHNFRNMNDTVRGPPKMINGVNWKIMVMPRQHVVQKKGTQKCLGFFLQCCPDSYSDSWSCQASAELRLISQKSGVPNFIRKTSHVYTAKENDWGYSCFMTWVDILEESSGYLKDEKVILEVYVKAEQPKGILTLEGFSKKIADYMRLAEMQSSRGLLDKAIEVNQSALKFCKDKHEDTKIMLEAQKSTLIEMKLKQSIERIEKGKTGPEGIEEPGTNLSTLRQALTGNLPSKAKTTKATSSQNKIKTKNGPNSNDCQNGENDDDESEVIDLTDEQNNRSSPTDELVDDIVHATHCKHHHMYHEHDHDQDQEACTSDEDDNGSGSSDEICDNCLQEKLDMYDNPDRRTTESGCQTDTNLMHRGSGAENLSASIDHDWGQLEINPDMGLMPAKRQHTGLSQAALKLEKDTLHLAGSRVPPRWTEEKEAELLQLITQVRGGRESRASLDSIRETLERLVTLAQDGDVPAELELEMAALRCTERLAANSEAANTDIIELPAAPPQEDSSIPPPPPPKCIDNKPKDDLPFPKGFLGLPPTKKANGSKLCEEEEHEAMLKDRSESASPPSPIELGDPESLQLLKQAKQMVDESKQEDVVNKYNQLVEQSEAARLAETVKKVEKRMKDIEKQTMTCRKELSDECDRHYKEEQKLIKTNKQIRQQLDQANDRAEKVNVQLRDRKAEIKRLEKKLKAESQQSVENGELMSRIEQLEKELTTVNRKLTDENKRHQKETQTLIDTRKQLQNDLQSASGEIERLNLQLDEKTSSLRKIEHSHENDKKHAKTSLKDALERAKKAEINLLEFKLEMGLKTLNRAQEECNSNLKQLDEVTKRTGKTQDELRPVYNYMQDWQKTKDKIVELTNKATTEFQQQIESIRGGKPLTLLALLEVPKPPPPPALPKFATLPPPAAQEAPKNPLPNPIGARRPPHVANVSTVNSSNTNGPMFGVGVDAPRQSAANSSAFSPQEMHVQPSHHSLGASAPGGGSSSASELMESASNNSSSHLLHNTSGGPHAGSSVLNGFSPWSDPLAGLGATLFNRGQQLGSLDAWPPTQSPHRPNSQVSAPGQPINMTPVGGGSSWSPMPQTVGPPPQHNAPPNAMQQVQNMAPGQWGVGWGYQQVTQAPPAPSPDPVDKTRSLSRGPGGSPIAHHTLVDSRSNSPSNVVSERTKRADALMEQLRATFPQVSGDILVDYVSEYRNQQPAKTLKGMSVEQALNGVVSLIMAKHKSSTWSGSSDGVTATMTLDTFVGGPQTQHTWMHKGKQEHFPQLST